MPRKTAWPALAETNNAGCGDSTSAQLQPLRGPALEHGQLSIPSVPVRRSVAWLGSMIASACVANPISHDATPCASHATEPVESEQPGAWRCFQFAHEGAPHVERNGQEGRSVFSGPLRPLRAPANHFGSTHGSPCRWRSRRRRVAGAHIQGGSHPEVGAPADVYSRCLPVIESNHATGAVYAFLLSGSEQPRAIADDCYVLVAGRVQPVGELLEAGQIQRALPRASNGIGAATVTGSEFWAHLGQLPQPICGWTVAKLVAEEAEVQESFGALSDDPSSFIKAEGLARILAQSASSPRLKEENSSR